MSAFDADCIITKSKNGKWPKIKKYYKDLKEIGSGGFATVYSGINRKDKKKYAVKIMKKKDLKDKDPNLHHLNQEISILGQLNHDSILTIKEVIITKTTICIVTDFLGGGDLLEKICETDEVYTEQDAAKVIKQVLSVLKYCHEKKIIHRDLKPENLMLKSEKSLTEIKVIDFGLAKLIEDGKFTNTVCGTPAYIAPEILLGKGHSFEVDLWSTGVITYCILSGIPPFWAEDQQELLKQIVHKGFDPKNGFPAEYWKNISDEAKDFICDCLEQDPNDRPSAAELLEHDWIQDYASDNAPADAKIKLDSAKKQLQGYLSEHYDVQKGIKYDDAPQISDDDDDDD